jgi:methionyl-tRNA formyltransferase
MDSGPIVAQTEVEINSTEKTFELRQRLIKIGGELLVKILPEIIKKEIKAVEQDEADATYCKKIKKEDGLIDLNDNAIKNYNKFRAYAYWPRTFFFSAKGGSASGGKNDKRVIITDAILENNQFVIKKVLPEGKKEIKYEDFLKTNI